MDDVVSQPQPPQTEVSQDSPQPATQQQAVETTPQQPLEQSPTTKKKRWLLPVLVVVVVLALGVGGYFVYRNIQLAKQVQTPEISETVSPPSEQLPKQTLEGEEQGVPEQNTLYLGSFEGKEVLFKRSCSNWNREDRLRYLKSEVYLDRYLNKTFSDEDEKYIGSLTAVTGYKSYSDSMPYDFRRLVNPRKIFTYRDCDFSLAGLEGVGIYNSDKSKIYVSLSLGSLDYSENKIFQIDLDSSGSKELWLHETGNPDLEEYDGYFGNAFIENVIQDKYIVFSVWGCNVCSPPSPNRVVVVLNIDTLNELYLGLVGNIQIDVSKNLVSYQNLSPFKESCEGCTGMCPGCMREEDGVLRKTVYKPAGQVLTEALP